MELSIIDSPFFIPIFKNTYENDELDLIWEELQFLTNNNIFQDPDFTGSAKNEEGQNIKKNKAIFLNDVYVEKNFSPIWRNSQQIINNVTSDIMQMINPLHSMFSVIDQSSVLVNYYEESSYYDYHNDVAAYTAVTVLYKEPKSFSGGELAFLVNGEEKIINMENNSTVIFPSTYQHKVFPITMNNERAISMSGRYSISNFLGISIR